MKRLALFTIIFLVALTINAQNDRGTTGTYHSRNLLINSGFEMDLSDWQAFGNANIVKQSLNPFSGFYSNEVSSASVTAGIEQDITARLNDYQPEEYWIGGAFKLSTSGSANITISVVIDGQITSFSANVSDSWQLIQNRLNLSWSGAITEAKIKITSDNSEVSFYCDEIWMRQAMDLSGRGYIYPAEFPVIQTFRNKSETAENLARFSIVHEMSSKAILEEVKSKFPDKTVVGQSSWGFAGRSTVKGDIWPGYYAYAEGLMLTQNLTTTATTVHITDVSKLVESQDGPNPYIDISIIKRNADGTPDWSNVEHCLIESVNISNNTITVQRAYENTTALSFIAGQAYIAQHPTWLGGTNAWMYNMSLNAPRRTDVATSHPEYGMNGGEYWAYIQRDHFIDKPHLDGIQYDVAKSELNGYGMVLDADCDMIPDWGWKDGMNIFGLGQQVVMQKMREYWGENKLFNVDGEGPAWVHTKKFVNGFQFEAGFNDIKNWGQQYDFLLNMSEQFTRDLRYTYNYFIQHDKPESEFRMAMAATTILEMPFSYNPDRGIVYITEKDEFWGGDLSQLGWLGEPAGPIESYYEFSTADDLFKNATWNVKTKSGFTQNNNNIFSGTGKKIVVESIPEGVAPDYYGVKLYTDVLDQSDLDANTIYTLMFEAKASTTYTYGGQTFKDVPSGIEAEGFAMMANSSNKSKRSGFMLDSDWRQYVVSYLTEETPDAGEIGFGVGYEIGTKRIKNIQLYKGSANRYMRKFENGLVLVNGSDKAWTIEIGSGYKKLNGSVNPQYNDGSNVGSTITVSPQDGIFLLKSNDPCTQAPAAPGNLSATATNCSTIALTWTDGDCEDSYNIRRWTDPSVKETIATLGADVTTFIDENINANTTYTYVVRAKNSYGTTNSNNATTTTPICNAPPVADAGPNQTTIDSNDDGTDLITLNGSGSSDSDGNITSYIWTENGSQIATGVSPTISLSVGVHNITLTVTDNNGEPDSDMVTITINEYINLPPTANAGIDQSLTDNDNDGYENVILNGSGSEDSDGTVASYIWTEGGTQIATGISPNIDLNVGVHLITLTVTDNDGEPATDEVTITIIEGSNYLYIDHNSSGTRLKASTTGGAVGTKAATSTGNNVQWLPEVVSGEWFYLIHKASNRKLYTADGTALSTVDAANTSTSAQWRWIDAAGGWYRLESREYTKWLHVKPDGVTDFQLGPTTWTGNNTKWTYTAVPKLAKEIETTSINADIYPNPATNEFVISGLKGESKIEILNIQGKIILNMKTYNQSEKFDIHTFPKGIYMIRISTKNSNLIQKLIIE